MKKKILTATIILVSITLLGCEKEEGIVIKKDYFPSQNISLIRPLRKDNCTHPLHSIEHQNREYNIVIRDGNNDYRINVDRDTYNNYSVGDKYYVIFK